MKKCMFLLVTMVIGFAVLSDVKPASAAQPSAQAQSLKPMTAEIVFYLYCCSPEGYFSVQTSANVASTVSYTVHFRGHTNGDFSFPIYSGNNSGYITFRNAALGEAEITAVYPESDGVYDYTAGIGANVSW